MANQATGRQTPVKEDCEILNHSFRNTVNRNGNGQVNTSGIAQAQSAFTLQRPPGSFRITDPSTTTRRPDVQSWNGMDVGDTSNRSLSYPTTTSTTTSTTHVVNTTSRNQVNVNTVPAQQPIIVPTDSPM